MKYKELTNIIKHICEEHKYLLSIYNFCDSLKSSRKIKNDFDLLAIGDAKEVSNFKFALSKKIGEIYGFNIPL